MFAENVEKRTNGEIKIIVYPNNARCAARNA